MPDLATRIPRIPLNMARVAWSFINPSRTAGRIPLGRLAIATQIVVAIAFLGYTLGKKSIRLPLSGEPYQVQIMFADAQGLDRLDEPAAAVAGTPLGSVTDVEYVGGHSLATLTFRDEVRGKLYADATASIRPASALQNLLVNVDPGTPEAGPLPDDEPIPTSRTVGYVTIDELTSVLDADTRAYLTILIEQAELALHGRDSEIREALGKVGDLVETTAPLADALADRRRLLTRLVGELETVVETVGKRGRQLSQAIATGSETLAVTTAREGELAAMTRDLGPVLTEADAAVGAAGELARHLVPALDVLIPAAEPLADSLARLNGLLPRAGGLVDRFEALVRYGREPLELMLEGTRGVKDRVQAMVPVMRDLTALSRRLDRRKEGMAQTADTLSSAFSYQDTNGAYGPIDVGLEHMKPENFGFGLSASDARRERFELAFAAALEGFCLTENPLACVYRFNVPGLPRRPVLRDVPTPRISGAWGAR